jgi:hypothetical protein
LKISNYITGNFQGLSHPRATNVVIDATISRVGFSDITLVGSSII